MKRTISLWFITVLLILSGAQQACAQWSVVSSTPIFGAGVGAAMHYKEGIVWAGGLGLWNSRDSGRTWKQCTNFPQALVIDICFFDSLTGAVATSGDVYLTTDGGNSWKDVLSGFNFRKVIFHRSPKIIHAAEIGGAVSTSTDGGSTWVTKVLGGDCRCLAVNIKGTLYAITAHYDKFGQYMGMLHTSTDLGLTWQVLNQSFFGDCYTISADSCDANRLYLVNEQIYIPSDSMPRTYCSSDGGLTWATTSIFGPSHYSGGMVTTQFGVFVGGMEQNGLSRSLDSGVNWRLIQGPACTPDARGLTAVNRNIVFAMDTLGNIWRTLNGGGDSVNEPLYPGTFTVTPHTLFAGDTVQCDSLLQTITVARSDCAAPYLGPLHIEGRDSNSYRITNSNESSITVSFFPTGKGVQNASLIVQATDGRRDTIALRGYAKQDPGTLHFQPTSLFTTDTVQCDSLERSIAITQTGCRPPSIVALSLRGQDSASFRATRTADSIRVLLLLKKPGAQQASLLVQLSNGKTDTIPLGGYWNTSGPFITTSIASTSDSVYPCDRPATLTLHFRTIGCPFPFFASERITGTNASDYSIVKGMSLPLTPEDSVVLSFLPPDTGWRTASYEFTLKSGKIITVPLSCYGSPQHTLTFSPSNVSVQTLGDNLRLPIKIDGLTRPEDIELTLCYDPKMFAYQGSQDVAGVSVDVISEQWAGHSRLRFTNATSPLLGYANFTVWNDTSGHAEQISFDSLSVLTEIGPCQYAIPLHSFSTVTSPSGCGMGLLSDWLRFSQPPRFSVAPNPTNGNVALTSSLDLGPSAVAVYDMLGTERERITLDLKRNAPQLLELPRESGLYYVKILSLTGEKSIGVVVNR